MAWGHEGLVGVSARASKPHAETWPAWLSIVEDVGFRVVFRLQLWVSARKRGKGSLEQTFGTSSYTPSPEP